MALKLTFSKPETAEIGTPEEPERITYADMRDAAQACREANFNPTAVVVRKSDTRPVTNLISYGVVVDLREYVHAQISEIRPIRVHWLQDGFETHERMEDLWLVNPAPSWTTTTRILNEAIAEERKKAS